MSVTPPRGISFGGVAVSTFLMVLVSCADLPATTLGSTTAPTAVPTPTPTLPPVHFELDAEAQETITEWIQVDLRSCRPETHSLAWGLGSEVLVVSTLVSRFTAMDRERREKGSFFAGLTYEGSIGPTNTNASTKSVSYRYVDTWPERLTGTRLPRRPRHGPPGQDSVFEGSCHARSRSRHRRCQGCSSRRRRCLSPGASRNLPRKV